MPLVVPVKFTYASRDLWFDPQDLDILEADYAICSTERGTEIGLVTADPLGLSELTGKELKEFSIAAHVQLRRFGKDLDFFIGNVNNFRAAVQNGRSFATELTWDGVILYGTFEA